MVVVLRETVDVVRETETRSMFVCCVVDLCRIRQC